MFIQNDAKIRDKLTLLDNLGPRLGHIVQQAHVEMEASKKFGYSF
jgi:hypothetical protein